MRVLLTGARAPATLDLARRFRAHGDEVYLCDSLGFGCANLSSAKTEFFKTPKPKQSYTQYVEKIQQIVKSHGIELLIPTCEEVFSISSAKNCIECEVLVDSLDKLREIHNKWTFAQSAANDHGRVPNTFLIESQSDLKRYHEDSKDYVFKPAYSRFASKTLIRPSAERLDRLVVSPDRPWIAQEFVDGIEYSSYSISYQGKLLAHCVYHSHFRAGVGAGICFESVSNESILQFVKQFVETNEFTGQIGFDFIVSKEGDVWVLEGNPRSTSGIHLFDRSNELIESIVMPRNDALIVEDSKPHFVGAAMLVYGLPNALLKGKLGRFLRAIYLGKDVLFRWSDPLPFLGMPITLSELGWIAIRNRITLQEATTWDIEWNGESFGFSSTAEAS